MAADTISIPRGEKALTAANPWKVNRERSPDQHTPTHYREQLEKSGHARMALRFTKNQIIGLVADYEHPDERIAEAVRFATRTMDGTWQGMLRDVLDAIWYGFDVHELVWDTAPPNPYGLHWHYAKIKATPPESWYPRGLVTDEHGNLTQCIQWRDQGEKQVVLEPLERVHWAYEGRGNVWGMPGARTANKWLESRNEVHDMWLMGMERLSAPIIVDIEPQGTVKERDTGLERSYAEFAAEGWNKVTSGGVLVREASIIRPSPGESGQAIVLPTVEVLRGDGWTVEFRDYHDYAAREIYIAIGIPPLLVMEPEHASRAHTETIAAVTALMLSPIAETFVEDVLIDQIVRPLVIANFGEQETYGDFPVTLPISEAETAQVVRDLWQSGFTMATSRPHYERIQRRVPGLLPEWEEVEGGDEGLPNVGEMDEPVEREIVVPEEAE